MLYHELYHEYIILYHESKIKTNSVDSGRMQCPSYIYIVTLLQSSQYSHRNRMFCVLGILGHNLLLRNTAHKHEKSAN